MDINDRELLRGAYAKYINQIYGDDTRKKNYLDQAFIYVLSLMDPPHRVAVFTKTSISVYHPANAQLNFDDWIFVHFTSSDPHGWGAHYDAIERTPAARQQITTLIEQMNQRNLDQQLDQFFNNVQNLLTRKPPLTEENLQFHLGDHIHYLKTIYPQAFSVIAGLMQEQDAGKWDRGEINREFPRPGAPGQLPEPHKSDGTPYQGEEYGEWRIWALTRNPRELQGILLDPQFQRKVRNRLVPSGY